MRMTPEPVASRPRRRWLIAVAVLSVVASTVALVVWRLRDDGTAVTRQSWQPAPSAMLSSPMRAQPVAGWRANVTDLGLPGPVDGTELSRVGNLNDPLRSRPLIGNHDDHAYFLASTPATPGPQWWVIGIDVRTGQRLFAPVKLDAGSRPPECFLNGPANLLCLSDDSSPTAYVVDVPSGTVAYNGPTDLRLGFATLAVEQVGNYAVAKTDGQGVYGIGLRAETTWFVPGNGRIQSGTSPRFELAPQALGVQVSADPRAYEMTVFSLRDGRVVKPEVDDGAHLGETEVYAGGFAAEVVRNRKSLGVSFFDDRGNQLGGHSIDGSLTGSVGLPIVASGGQSAIYSPDGHKLMDLPGGAVHLIGTTLFVNENKSEAFPMWRQYELKTGTKGPACDFNMSNFLGINGSAIVFSVTNPDAGFVAKARDLGTCETLWTLPSRVNSFAQVWRVNTTLVQLSDDGTELFSLVAPK
ncbi:hypothetical protein [Mycobacterium sp. MMS18-G62]